MVSMVFGIVGEDEEPEDRNGTAAFLLLTIMDKDEARGAGARFFVFWPFVETSTMEEFSGDKRKREASSSSSSSSSSASVSAGVQGEGEEDRVPGVGISPRCSSSKPKSEGEATSDEEGSSEASSERVVRVAATEDELRCVPYGYTPIFDGMLEGDLSLFKAIELGLVGIAGLDGYPESFVERYHKYGNLSDSELLPALWKAVDRETYSTTLRDVEGMVVYTPAKDDRFREEEREESVQVAVAMVLLDPLPTEHVFLNPFVVSLLFGESPHVALGNWDVEEFVPGMSVSKFNESKRDASELLSTGASKKKARDNLLAALQKKVDEKDRERVADEMLEMVQDIYVTARFDKATPRERFLMYKMMLLAYHEHYVS